MKNLDVRNRCCARSYLQGHERLFSMVVRAMLAGDFAGRLGRVR